MTRDLRLIAAALFLWGVGEGMFMFFNPIYLQQLGANPLTIGAILSGFSMTMTLAHIPAGYLSDRIGRQPLILAAWIMALVAAWIMALSNSLHLFVIGLFFYGLTFFVMAPLNAYSTAARGNWSIGRALLITSASFNLGYVFGPLIGGRIADHFTLKQVFLSGAVVLIFSTLTVLFIHKQPLDHHPDGEKRLGFVNQPSFVTYMLVVFLAIFAAYLPQPFSQNYLHNQWGLSLTTIGTLSSLAGVGVVIFALAVGNIETRKGFLFAQAAVGGFSLLMWKGSSLPWFALAYFLLGGFKTTRSLATAQVRYLVNASSMGLAYGITETIGGLSFTLAPLIAGFLYNQNPSWVYPVGLTLSVISILVGIRFAPKPSPRDTTSVGQSNIATESLTEKL